MFRAAKSSQGIPISCILLHHLRHRIKPAINEPGGFLLTCTGAAVFAGDGPIIEFLHRFDGGSKSCLAACLLFVPLRNVLSGQWRILQDAGHALAASSMLV